MFGQRNHALFAYFKAKKQDNLKFFMFTKKIRIKMKK